MSLIIFAFLGFCVGFWLEMTRRGYIAMALTAVAFFAGEIIHALAATNPASLTLLPLVVGLLLVTSMLAGALARLLLARSAKTA
jgi:hypothetical protein